MARWCLGLAYLLPALSVAGASLASPWLRFHIPLIKPDVRFSRTRLSDKAVLTCCFTRSPTNELPLGSLQAGIVPAPGAGIDPWNRVVTT